MSIEIKIGDCIEQMRMMPEQSVHCCVTSPPYFGLRDYGVDGQIGMEPTPDAFVQKMVEVFREVRRVLRDDGTLWLNLGDSYNSVGGGYNDTGSRGETAVIGAKTQSAVIKGRNREGHAGLKAKDLIGIPWLVAFALRADGWYLRQDIIWQKPNPMPESVRDRCTKAHEYIFLLSKSERYFCDMEAIAEPLGLASIERLSQPSLDQQNGSDRVPGKTNGNMKAVGRRAPGNKTHKSITEYENSDGEHHRTKTGLVDFAERERVEAGDLVGTRNKRSVWTVATQPFKEAHFATFPPDLIEPCILAGTSAIGCCSACGAQWVRQVAKEFVPQPDVSEEKGIRGAGDQKPMDESNTWNGHARGTTTTTTTGWAAGCACDASIVPCTVLDPFGGAGTTALVSDRHHRNAVLVKLNPAYAQIARARLHGESPLFAQVGT